MKLFRVLYYVHEAIQCLTLPLYDQTNTYSLIQYFTLRVEFSSSWRFS